MFLYASVHFDVVSNDLLQENLLQSKTMKVLSFAEHVLPTHDWLYKELLTFANYAFANYAASFILCGPVLNDTIYKMDVWLCDRLPFLYTSSYLVVSLKNCTWFSLRQVTMKIGMIAY